MKTKLGYGIGDFVIVKEGVDRYRYTTEGTILLVCDFGTRRWDGTKMVLGYCLNEAGQGKQMDIEAEDVRLATPAEVEARKKEVADLRQLSTKQAYRTGDCVVFSKDYKTSSHGPFESGTMTLRRGQKAIVDLAPNPDEDDGDDEENSAKGETSDVDDNTLVAGSTRIKLREFVGPMVRVYLTDLEDEFDVPLGVLARPKEEFLGSKLILPDGYMDRLTTLMRRVTNKEIAQKIYEDLGLSRVCQKGRGAIILLYGPPGTGKTMTAEVVAEKMGRPLISLKLGALNNSEALAKKLAAGFQRAAKYKAVLLLDEVDVFIRKRGGHPVFDENTSTFLRVLEYFDGVLVMTTNLVSQIDEAVFSRVHLCLEYGAPQDSDRRAIWASMFSKELLDAVTGDDAAHEAMLDMLSKKKLNGREIKTVIQNAVGKAVARMVDGDKGLPRTKWINRAYFIEEAERLATMREELKRE